MSTLRDCVAEGYCVDFQEWRRRLLSLESAPDWEVPAELWTAENHIKGRVNSKRHPVCRYAGRDKWNDELRSFRARVSDTLVWVGVYLDELKPRKQSPRGDRWLP